MAWLREESDVTGGQATRSIPGVSEAVTMLGQLFMIGKAGSRARDRLVLPSGCMI
jgi:hypothetical protein